MTLKEEVNIVSKYFIHPSNSLSLKIVFFFFFNSETAFFLWICNYSFMGTLFFIPGVCDSLRNLAGIRLSEGSVHHI